MAFSLSLLTSVPGVGGQPNQPMGLGPLVGGSLIFKRKFRWTMEIEYCAGTTKTVPKEFVKIGSRPQLDIEETEINYLHGRMWLPGKAVWQTMTVAYFDLAGTPPVGVSGSLTDLYGWIASVYDIADPIGLSMGSRQEDYNGRARILLYDGCGKAVEGWLLENVWPQAINWGELDMGSSDECTVEMTLRYTQVSYRSYCPAGTPVKCPCTACS